MHPFHLEANPELSDLNAPLIRATRLQSAATSPSGGSVSQRLRLIRRTLAERTSRPRNPAISHHSKVAVSSFPAPSGLLERQFLFFFFLRARCLPLPRKGIQILSNRTRINKCNACYYVLLCSYSVTAARTNYFLAARAIRDHVTWLRRSACPPSVLYGIRPRPARRHFEKRRRLY